MGEVEEYCATPPCNSWLAIVIECADNIVDVVLPTHLFVTHRKGQLHLAVILSACCIIAPPVSRFDRAHPGLRSRSLKPVGAKKMLCHGKSAGRRCAIALAFGPGYSVLPECAGNNHPACLQERTMAAAFQANNPQLSHAQAGSTSRIFGGDPQKLVLCRIAAESVPSSR